MKKIYILLFVCMTSISVHAASYTIAINGFFYSPPSLTVSIEDVVTIQANTSHPAVEVDQPTWNANGTTPMTGGWGIKSADYTFTITSTNSIYFVCQIHVGTG